jgi:L-lactate dehydrogenase complex protein LldE
VDVSQEPALVHGEVESAGAIIAPARRRVGLFVTCLVNLMRPRIGFAALDLLERAGCDVAVPATQTCCGQPAYNSGDRAGAAAMARHLIAAFEEFDHVVVPSGSCAGMIHVHFPELLKDDPDWQARAIALAAKTHELLSFLVDVCHWHPDNIHLPATATYHVSCSGLREMGVSGQPKQLLASIGGLSMLPLRNSDTCCGFGGTFCVKYPAISNAICGEKAQAVEDSSADLLLGGDLGCLMLISGTLHRRGSAVRVFHTAEILAGFGDGPALGEEP